MNQSRTKVKILGLWNDFVGDVEDTSIADLTVATNCGSVKTGSVPCEEQVTF